MQVVKRVEKLFLCGLFSDDKLDIVDQQNVDITVLFTEFCHSSIIAVSDRFNQFIRKGFTRYIKYSGLWIIFQDKVCDRVHQMGFPQSNTSVEEEGVVDFARGFGNCQRCSVCKFVVASDNEVFKGIFRI